MNNDLKTKWNKVIKIMTAERDGRRERGNERERDERKTEGERGQRERRER